MDRASNEFWGLIGLNVTGYGIIEFESPQPGVGRGRIVGAGVIRKQTC